MRAKITAHAFSGVVRIPASKSHTIRQLLIASLADGVSEIRFPLDSLDVRSCVEACRVLGAKIEEHRSGDPLCQNPPAEDGTKLSAFTVTGNAGVFPGGEHFIDVGNSGTTLYLAMAIAGLGCEPIEFSGDEQIQRRGAGPLLKALKELGVRAESRKNNDCVPIVIQGPWKGGAINLPCPLSQYLSALLLAAPLAPAGTLTEIEVPLLNERPYIEITLSYLDAHGIPWKAPADFSHFSIPGGSRWKPFARNVPGDFSSAAFPAAAAVISGNALTILGLDPDDPQGDKSFFDILAQMGCAVKWEKTETAGNIPEWSLSLSRSVPLKGGTFDLNATPDMLPILAVCAAFAEGDTALVNVAHARDKETDRIAVMAKELGKLGIETTEKPDGLIIHGKGACGKIAGGLIDSHGDHRIAMAFAAAAMGTASPIEIENAECAAVSYPGFLELLNAEIAPDNFNRK